MMMLNLKLKNILLIVIGSAIFAFGIVHFNMQNNLSEGGFTGIQLLLYFLWDWDPAVLNILLNIPVLIVGWKFLGKRTLLYTIIGITAVSLFLSLFQTYPLSFPLHENMTLAALFAGVFVGVGLGIIFRYGGTTGGSDIIARIVFKYTGWSMGKSMFAFDFLVIISSLIVYLDLIEGMYTLVAIYVGARCIDVIQEGAYSARSVVIISHSNNRIAEHIISKMNRGVTTLFGEGSFTEQKRNVIYCVVGRNEINRLKSIITSIDPYAFVAINHVHDVAGEGFTLDENKKPIYE